MKTFEEYIKENSQPKKLDISVPELAKELITLANAYGQEMYDLGQLKEHESKQEVTH